MTRGNYIEIACETRHIQTTVRWYKGTDEIKHGERYTFKQCGYSHRLLIKDIWPTEEGDITAIAGPENVSVHIDTKGEPFSKIIYAEQKF